MKTCVTLSLVEVEYISLAGCKIDAFVLSMFLESLSHEWREMRVNVSEENEGLIKLVSNPTVRRGLSILALDIIFSEKSSRAELYWSILVLTSKQWMRSL